MDPGEAGIREAENAWSRAFVTGDAAYLDDLLDSSYVSVNAKGDARAKSQIIALARQFAADHPGAKAQPLSPTSIIQVKGAAAVVTHRNEKDTSVDVFYYVEGRWRAWFSQHTSIPLK
ncbi:MAG: hypothetical protein H6P99_816 [Holophagaceae bacterium]|nr:hypothetical protein [Holophagaceae bacterium]